MLRVVLILVIFGAVYSEEGAAAAFKEKVASQISLLALPQSLSVKAIQYGFENKEALSLCLESGDFSKATWKQGLEWQSKDHASWFHYKITDCTDAKKNKVIREFFGSPNKLEDFDPESGLLMITTDDKKMLGVAWESPPMLRAFSFMFWKEMLVNTSPLSPMHVDKFLSKIKSDSVLDGLVSVYGLENDGCAANIDARIADPRIAAGEGEKVALSGRIVVKPFKCTDGSVSYGRI